MECKVNLSVSQITPTEFNKTKFEFGVQTEVLSIVNVTHIDINFIFN